MARRALGIGSKVMVNISDGTQTNDPAAKLNGQIFTTKRKVFVSATKWYWELEGATSKMGVPFGFLEEELKEL